MPTRALIGRRDGLGVVSGVLLRSDGFPDYVVPSLIDMTHRAFSGDINNLSSTLIDAHPAGWERIGMGHELDDFSVCGLRLIKPGRSYTIDDYIAISRDTLQCRCHGDGTDSPLSISCLCGTDLVPADRSFHVCLDYRIDYVYVLSGDGVEVSAFSTADDRFCHVPLGTYRWDQPYTYNGMRKIIDAAAA